MMDGLLVLFFFLFFFGFLVCFFVLFFQFVECFSFPVRVWTVQVEDKNTFLLFVYWVRG